MKNSFTLIIFTMICLLPTFLLSQAPPAQNQIQGNGTPLRAMQLNSMQIMTGPPLLRVSNIGSSGQDGVSIQLNDISLMNPGPSLLFDFPALGTTGGGDIKLQPGNGKPLLQVSNIGSSGQDGVRLKISSPPNLTMLDSFFDVFYNLRTHTETHSHGIIGDPDFDLLRITSYDRATPKLSEKIASSKPALSNSFFDIFYDLTLGTRGVGFGNNPDDICCITTFDKATPKLAERISSDAPGAHGFFDIFYDLSLGRETHAHGDPDFDLLVSRTYNKTSRVLLDSIYSHNLMTNSFFDIFYDLGMGTETHVHGDPDFDLLVTRTYDKATPKLQEKMYSRLLEDEGIWYNIHNLHTGEQTVEYCDTNYIVGNSHIFDTTIPRLSEKISSTNPLRTGFFDLSYDMHLGSESHAFRVLAGDPDFDLLVVRNYDKATPKLQETISSSNPALVNSFFDISYDLNAKRTKCSMSDMSVSRTFAPATPKLQDIIASSNPLFSNSFFDITYDLNAKQHKIRMEDLIVSSTFSSSTPKFGQKITSSLLPYIDNFFDISYDLALGINKTNYKGLLYTVQYRESDWDFVSRISTDQPLVPGFFDISYNIGLGDLLKQSTKAGVTGGLPLELRYEYDGLNRKIREIRADNQSGSFFDITYDLPAKFYKIMLEDLIVSSYYYPATPKFQNMISSTNPAFSNSFFDITYDLALGTQKTQYKDLKLTINSSEPSTICWNVSSNLPGIPGHFDVCHNIGLASLQTISTKAGAPGTPELEQRYEYDALSRKIREVSTDLNNSATLTVERRLLPAGSSLFVSNKMEIQGALEVQGTVSTPGAGPLVIADNIMVNGAAHQVNGNLTVTGAAHTIGGNVQVNGNFNVTGAKTFKIDHPLDPDNKYLFHSCIESPDMMNVYNGNAMTDEKGYVTIKLPDYFEALNTDFRYQLTCMGQFAQAIVAEKINNNKFIIRTDKPNVEVSWQVTGIRNDPASKKSKYAVEVEKEADMKGTRLYNK